MSLFFTHIRCTLALMVVAFAGCLPWEHTHVERVGDDKLLQVQTFQDSSFIEYIFLEQPLGQEIIDRNVWQRIDETVIPVELRDHYRTNGIRVGVVGVNTSPEIANLVALNGKHNGPRSKQFSVFEDTTLPMNQIHGELEVPVYHVTGNATTLKKRLVRFFIRVSVRPQANGSVIVKLTPEFSASEHELFPAGMPSLNDNAMQRKPTELLSALEMEIPLGPREFLVLGTDSLRPETLGHKVLVERKGDQQIQNLLVIRAGYNGDPSKFIGDE